ncbi:MAG: 50S ribosomal protein L28 [Pseudomonadota bacterium]
MARVCELSGKRPMVGNNVSHAKNRTRRRFLPNLVKASLMSESLGKSFKFRLAASTLRTVEHRGGLDMYLAKAKSDELSIKARRIKRDITKASASKAAA